MFIYSSFFLILTFISIKFMYFNLSSSINFCWTWDYMSSTMMMLSFWIMALIILTESKFIFKLIILLITMIISFNTKNILMFFISFEISIIPILLIILFKGSQPERLEASMNLLLYTFSASTPLLFCTLYLWYMFNSPNLLLLFLWSNELMMLMMLAFLVKLPMWGMHLWLPKAHVEAPIGGSMILAAIMLKLGMYGMYRIFMLSNSTLKSSIYFISVIGLLGILISGIMCFMSPDIKILIAYSSISHMSPTLMILIQYNNLSFMNIIMLALSHGFSSSLMFFTGNLIYMNSKSRSMLLQKGGLMVNSIMALILFWSIMLNMAIPPFLTFFSEILMLIILMMQSYSILIITLIMIMITGLYNTYLFVNLSFGKEKFLNTKMIKMKELLIFFMHVYPLIFSSMLY